MRAVYMCESFLNYRYLSMRDVYLVFLLMLNMPFALFVHYVLFYYARGMVNEILEHLPIYLVA